MGASPSPCSKDSGFFLPSTSKALVIVQPNSSLVPVQQTLPKDGHQGDEMNACSHGVNAVPCENSRRIGSSVECVHVTLGYIRLALTAETLPKSCRWGNVTGIFISVKVSQEM